MTKGKAVIMDHFSVDLETLGTRYDAPILSIGVVQFDPETDTHGQTFYREIDLHSALKAGNINADTLSWWMQRDAKVINQVFGKENKVVLSQALDELCTWMRARHMAPKVWGNGATFDISILEHAYDHGAIGQKEPWHYTNIRDVRTALDLTGTTAAECWPFPRDSPHNTLNDAIFQAHVISVCWIRIKAGIVAINSGISTMGAKEKRSSEKPNSSAGKTDSSKNLSGDFEEI